MKDRQIYTAGPQPRVPVLSSVFHLIAMPAIVFLRSGFGYSFLSPKSVFFAFSWATVLFAIYSWLEEGAWQSFWAVSSFGVGAVLLYSWHLLMAFWGETQRSGKHDFFSGSSHILRLPGLSHYKRHDKAEVVIQWWGEPIVLLVAAAVLRVLFAELCLSRILPFVALALWCKEFVNYWYHLRHSKKQQDVFEDAEQTMEGNPSEEQLPSPTGRGRKVREARPRERNHTSDQDLEHRHAEVLRLMPPHDLQQAERNYRSLIKTCHPDPNDTSATNNDRAAQFNDAIEFFRNRSSGHSSL